MDIYASVLLAGFFGGVVRGLVGFLKHQFAYKNVPFDLKKFFFISFISGIIGLMSAASVKGAGFVIGDTFTPAISFIVGYAGGDFLENIYKIIVKKMDIYNAKKGEK